MGFFTMEFLLKLIRSPRKVIQLDREKGKLEDRNGDVELKQFQYREDSSSLR